MQHQPLNPDHLAALLQWAREALLTFVASDGGCAWMFGPVTTYARPLPHPSPRGMSSPMPAAPVGTLTAAHDWDAFH